MSQAFLFPYLADGVEQTLPPVGTDQIPLACPLIQRTSQDVLELDQIEPVAKSLNTLDPFGTHYSLWATWLGSSHRVTETTKSPTHMSLYSSYCFHSSHTIHLAALFFPCYFCQPIVLLLLDITPMLPVLDGVVMELQDCALPLLKGNHLTVDKYWSNKTTLCIVL